MKTAYSDVTACVTKHCSTIRELMHPAVHGNRRQSLAEAIVEPGAQTTLHRHSLTAEIYHITAGEGWMTLGELQFAAAAGDTVCIAPDTSHCIANSASAPLNILCACSPAYSHDDKQLL